MADFSNLFGPDRDIVSEISGNTPGNIIRIASNGVELEGFSLTTGVGTSEIISETQVTAVLDLSAAPTFAASGSTTSSTITYTSTATEVLTDAFSAGDLIFFSGTFASAGSAINAAGTAQSYTPQAAFGTGDYTFAFPIASITGTSGAWTVVLNLNVPPFKAWQEASTDALVTAHSFQGASYPSANQTEIFFATAVVTGNLDVSLRTTTTVSEVEISQYADGDLEIAGINAEGVVVNLTSGDFGTAGQAVIVNDTADGLIFSPAIDSLSQAITPEGEGSPFTRTTTTLGVQNSVAIQDDVTPGEEGNTTVTTVTIGGNSLFISSAGSAGNLSTDSALLLNTSNQVVSASLTSIGGVDGLHAPTAITSYGTLRSTVGTFNSAASDDTVTFAGFLIATDDGLGNTVFVDSTWVGSTVSFPTVGSTYSPLSDKQYVITSASNNGSANTVTFEAPEANALSGSISAIFTNGNAEFLAGNTLQISPDTRFRQDVTVDGDLTVTGSINDITSTTTEEVYDSTGVGKVSSPGDAELVFEFPGITSDKSVYVGGTVTFGTITGGFSALSDTTHTITEISSHGGITDGITIQAFGFSQPFNAFAFGFGATINYNPLVTIDANLSGPSSSSPTLTGTTWSVESYNSVGSGGAILIRTPDDSFDPAVAVDQLAGATFTFTGTDIGSITAGSYTIGSNAASYLDNVSDPDGDFYGFNITLDPVTQTDASGGGGDDQVVTFTALSQELTVDGDLTVTGGITGNLALDLLSQTGGDAGSGFTADGTVASTTNYKIEVVPANTTVTTPLANTIYLHLES